MGKVFAFHGGIHPPENKHQSSQSPIALAPLAKQLFVPIQQHIGVAATPCIEVGDYVLKGQRIADANGYVSVAVHAPSSGKVTAIGEHPIPHPSGMQGVCITIETDGLDQWIEHKGLDNYKSLPKSDLIDYIRDRGIAGMGGAGFPTAVKLHLGDDHIVNTLIINAAECEPYITADDLLIRERAEQIIAGIEILQHLIKPSHILIGIEDNKPQAFRALETALKDCPYNIDVVCIPTKYPSGGEKQLIKLLTNIEVPSGKIPADVGIVCQNIGTVYAVHRAVNHGESLISRIVTVTGDGVVKAQNYETLIGTPFSLLLEAAGQYETKTSRLVVGGPMMGYTIKDTEIPVVKTSNCLIAATEQEMPTPEFAQSCIRCGLCEQVCPVELLPQQLHWFAKSKEYDKAKHHNLFDCIECGACSYVCPSNIPLVQYYRHAKTSIRQEDQEKKKADLARERFEAKQQREERAVAEKAAKRKARAEQAAKAQSEKKAASEKSTNTPDEQLKSLKTAVAIARTKVSKAEKSLDLAKESLGDVTQCDLQLQQAKSSLAKAEAALAQLADAKDNTVEVDSKKLKIAAAVARTKLKKAQQALKSAQEKGLDGIEQLTKTLNELETQAIEAEQAYQSSEQGQASEQSAAKPTAGKTTLASTTAAPQVDSKKLKTAAAVARTKLKKAIALQDRAATAEEAEQYAAEIQQLEQKVLSTEAAYKAAQSNTGTTTVNLSELEATRDKSLAILQKAISALEKAEASNSPAVEKMRLSIEKLRAKSESAENRLKEAQKATVPETTDTPVEPAPVVDKKALKQNVAISRTKLKKLEKQISAETDGPSAEQTKELERLKATYQQAVDALESVEAAAFARAKEQGLDLKQLRIDAALAKAAETKLLKALKQAQEAEDEAQIKTVEQSLEEAKKKTVLLTATLQSIEE